MKNSAVYTKTRVQYGKSAGAPSFIYRASMSVITFGPPPVVDEDEEDVFLDAALEIVKFDVIQSGSPTSMLLSIFSDKEMSIGPEERDAEPPKLPIEDFTKGLAFFLDAGASDAAAHLEVANSDDPVMLGAPFNVHAKEWLFDLALQVAQSKNYLTPERFLKYAPLIGLGKWLIHPMNAFITTLKYAKTDNACETFVNMSIIWAALYTGSYAISTTMGSFVMERLEHYEYEVIGAKEKIEDVARLCTPFDSTTGKVSNVKRVFQAFDRLNATKKGLPTRCDIAVIDRDAVLEWAKNRARTVAKLVEAGLSTLPRPVAKKMANAASTMSIPLNVMKSLRGHFCETFMLKEKGLTDREMSGYREKMKS